jgi:hypothetical protein
LTKLLSSIPKLTHFEELKIAVWSDSEKHGSEVRIARAIRSMLKAAPALKFVGMRDQTRLEADVVWLEIQRNERGGYSSHSTVGKSHVKADSWGSIYYGTEEGCM